MLIHLVASIPLFFARCIPSAIASIEEITRKLLQSLATCAASTSFPNSHTPTAPDCCNKGFAISIACLSPETRKLSFLALTASGRPITGLAR